MLVVLSLALGGIWLGLRAAGPGSYETALGRVSVEVSPALHGRVDAFIPIADWGVRAHPFSAPIRLEVEPRSLDRQALISAVGGNGSVLAESERDAQHAATRALVRALLWAVGGGIAAGAVLALAVAAAATRRPPVLVAAVAAPALTAAAIALVTLLAARATFDPDAFDHPSFFARGAELSQLVDVAEKAREGSQSYSSSVQRTIAGYAALLSAGVRLRDVTAAPRALLASDFHNNVLAINPLARLFSKGPAFVPGDLGQSGSGAEARLLVPRVHKLGSPIVAVSGNHDSRLLMRRLARSGAIVLTGSGRLRADGSTDGRPVQRIAGLRMAGIADPLEWRGRNPDDPRRVFSFAQLPNGRERYARVARSVVDWFDSLPERPQVVLIHQNGLAQNLARTLAARRAQKRLLILTGHDHKQHIDRYGHIVVADAGSAGAGGPFGARTTPVGVALLHFPGAGRLPSAIDMIRVEPFSGAASAARAVLSSRASCESPVVFCHDRGAAP